MMESTKEVKERVVRKLEGSHKYLWCSKCKTFPDKIIEKNILYEGRVWNEDMDCYEFDDDVLQDEELKWSKCAKCETKLEERE